MRSFVTTVLTLIAGAGIAPACAQTKWNAADPYPPANYHVETLTQFAKDVGAGTAGKLQITVHPSASLFKAPEIKRAVQTGQAQIGDIPISLLENESPIYGTDVLPFVVSTFDDAKKLYEAQKPFLESKLNSQGLMLLYSIPWPPQGIYSANPINSMDDMKGLKWRSSLPVISKIGELAGAQPVTIQEAELAQAMATGVVNSALTSSMTGATNKIWESLKYYYDVKAYVVRNMVFANKAAFDALDPKEKEAIRTAAAKAEEHGWKIAPERDAAYLDELRQHGMTVSPGSAALNEGLKKIGKTLSAEWAKRAGADGDKILARYHELTGTPK